MKINNAGPAELEQFARRFASLLGKGDTFFLIGDLGAGKSTFARAIIRAVAGEDDLEVPSPTFPLLIPYQTSRTDIAHFDLYRLSDNSEVEELGLYDNLEQNLTLIEWPDQLGKNHRINDRFEISFIEQDAGNSRDILITAFGSSKAKLERFSKIKSFLKQTNFSEANWSFLQGDASTRSYVRLERQGEGGHEEQKHNNQIAETALLMNAPPQPDGAPIKNGKPYSQIAHLAENMTSFVAVSKALSEAGLTVPIVEKFDIENGLLLISDLGDDQYYHLIAEEEQNQKKLYEPAIDVLIKLRQHKPATINVPNGTDSLTYNLPPYDETALGIESELVIDWYWPVVRQQMITDAQRKEYQAIWQGLFKHLRLNNQHWVIRDFHSPNLMRINNQTDLKSVGIIDFQDAVIGHAAYDVVSLTEDARYTVPADLEAHLLNRYIEGARKTDNSFDEEDFRKAYAILGAQRASKLLGIFVRLAVRDGKVNYLTHIPRIWDYLQRSLVHKDLKDLANWYQTWFQENQRAIWFENLPKNGLKMPNNPAPFKETVSKLSPSNNSDPSTNMTTKKEQG